MVPPQNTRSASRRILFSKIARLLLPLLLLTFSTAAQAQFTYSTYNNQITITGYSGTGGAVTIPSTINGLPVSKIGDNAFYKNASLTRVTIPGSVTGIGVCAFYWCYNLTSVTIPSGVTSIGDSAFEFCGSLSGVTIPNSVIEIGGNAFSNCTNLASAAIGNKVASIGRGAFSFCPKLPSVIIPASVTTIGEFAFGECTSLTSITVDASNSAFSSLDGVLFNKSKTLLIEYPPGKPSGSYAIPSSVTTIRVLAFYDCSNLTGVTIPNSVTSIESQAYEHCTGLSSLTVGSGVATMGHSVFQGCSALTKATILGGVTTIEASAFTNCTALTEVTIPASVTIIEEGAFEECPSLKSVTIPASVRSIGDGAFSGSGLTSVAIPGGVTRIGDRVFEYCGSLTSVTIPSGVTSIGYLAFWNCANLTNVTIPSSVTTIGQSAFGGCAGLTSVIIPNKVTRIADSVFEYCSSLTSVTIPTSVTAIESNAFSFCSSLISVTIPNSVTALGDFAFYNCSALTSVAIPNSVTTLGAYAFGFCTGLTSVTIPDSVTSIGADAFYNCTGLTSVTIGSGVTSLGDEAFAYCSSLKSAVFRGNAPSLGTKVFRSAASGFTVQYYNGATGFFSSPWDGYTTIGVPRPASANANLSALAITSGTLSPVFASSGTNYTATVRNNITSVTVTRTPADATATIQVTGGAALVVGSNTITVKVTAQDRTTIKTYRIIVTREAAPVAVNDSVVAHGGSVTFDPRANDSDPKGRALLVISAGVASYGTVTRTGTSVTYRPGATYAGHDSFLYTVSNGFGGTATAMVTVTEPTVALTGTYRGILSVSGTGSGFCTLSTGTNRAFSATLFLYAEKQVIAGTFNAQGYFIGPIAVLGGKTLNLALRLVPGTNSLTGTVGCGATIWSVSLARTYPAYSTTSPTPFAGRYTVLFPLNPALVGQAAYPQGTGYATMVVSNDGTATLAGKLGDGTPLSITSALTNAGQFPLYQVLSSGTGAYIAGVITFGNVASVSDAAGTLHWVKPAQSVAQAYQAGFVTNLSAVASKFPSATPVLGKSGTMTVKGGTLTVTLTKTVTIPASGGALVITPNGTDGTTLSVDATTGLITGTFLPGWLANPSDSTRRSVYGVLFPKQNTAGGLFIQTTKTGQFRIGLR